MSILRKLVLAAVLGFFLAACGSSGPEAVAKQYIEYIYDGKPDKVLELIHIPKEKGKESGMEDIMRGKIKAMVASVGEKAKAQGGVKSIEAAAPEMQQDGERAMVKVTVSFKNAGSTPQIEQVKLIKVDGKWKVAL